MQIYLLLNNLKYIQQINEESAQQIIIYSPYKTYNQKSFISLTSIFSDIQQKYPTINFYLK